MDERKNVLVFGGTGAMGIYLVPLLVDYGYEVFVTSRRDIKTQRPHVHYLKGNAKDTVFLDGLNDGTEYVALFDFMMYSVGEFEQRLEKLLTLSDQYFYFSSYRVFADSQDPLTEDSLRKIDLLESHPDLSIDAYGIRKGQQENTLIAASRRNWTIIRPTMTYAEGRFQFGAIDNFDVIRAQRGLTAALPDSISGKMTSLTYGKDVAKILVSLIGCEKAFGESFNTATGENHKWTEVADIFKSVFDMKCTIVGEKAYAAAYGHASALFDSKMNREFDPSKVYSVTGLSKADFYTLEEGLREAWLNSDRDRFRNAMRAIDSHVKADQITNSKVDYRLFPKDLIGAYHEASLRIRGDYVRVFPAPPNAATEDKSKRMEESSSQSKTSLAVRGIAYTRKHGIKKAAKKSLKYVKRRLR